MRSLDHSESTAAIVVGVEEEDALREFTRASGGNDYVTKSDHFSGVQEMVRRMLKNLAYDSARYESGTASRPDKWS